MSQSTKLLLSLVSIILLCRTNSIYLLLTKGEPKCLIDEYYKDQIVIIKYQTMEDFHDLVQERNSEPVFHVAVGFSKEEDEVETYQLGNTVGKLNINISKDGLYQVCFIANASSSVFAGSDLIKLMLSFDSMAKDKPVEINMQNLPKHKDFQVISTRMRKIVKKIDDITRTQNYQMEKEEQFSQESSKNARLIKYMTIVQIGILIMLSIWQVYSFKHLFKDAF